MGVFRKDPDALLDYKVDWQSWLGSDNIVSAATSSQQSSPAITSAGTIIVANSVVSANGLSHVIWLSAGTLGNEYSIISRIWSSAGRRNDYTFTVRVEAR